MKVISYLLMTHFAGAALAVTAHQGLQGQPRLSPQQASSQFSSDENALAQPGAPAAQTEAAQGDSSALSGLAARAAPLVPATGSPDNMARLHFVDAPLTDVLNYLSDTYGFIITGQTEIGAKASVIANTPIRANDAVKMLNSQLASAGYQAIQTGKTLNIISLADARRLTPIYPGGNPINIPIDDIVVTQILPVHSLTPSQLAKDLQPLVQDQDKLIANEAGNALIVTAAQKDIHRLAEIIQALDSTTVCDVRVFVLGYGDAASIASELKDIFTDPNTQQANLRSLLAARFARFPGGPDGSGNQGDNSSSMPAIRVNAVADEQHNAVVVSAPTEYMESISNLIAQLDQPSEDVTQVRLFPLRHADSIETANELAALFPDDTDNSTSGGRSMGFQFVAGQRSAAQQSQRMKRKGRVMAVADPRTGSVIVTAAKALMDQIAAVIDRLDGVDAHQQKVVSIPIAYADPAEVLAMMQDLFRGPNALASSSSTVQSALETRQIQSSQQSQNGLGTSSFGSGNGTSTTALH